MRALSWYALWAVAVAVRPSTALSQSLPYNPVTILRPPGQSWNNDLAYVFLPSPSTPDYYLASLNVSSTVSSSVSLDTISRELPFTSDSSKAFLPSISPDGSISVYAGSCSNLDNSLWIFTPSNVSSEAPGNWTKQDTSISKGLTPSYLPGANFLAQSISFSPFVEANASQTDLYVFGGMCPNKSATASTWQSDASYSSHMLRITPKTSDYNLQIAHSSAPPIAEAGFSFTGLSPSVSNGAGVATQQQNFVLLGGHTQTAFINMSQVAIWSLPEESWSFVTVDAPAPPQSPNTELTVKSAVAQVDSRSGHTAVLSEDGSKVIVLGGWVGDTSQAADPQLAVLELGAGFGGAGNWAWSIPSEQPPGNGIYGHGAAMLPGGVMMVLGGFNISGSSNSKRDASSDIQPMFFNTTTLSWISNYTNPAYIAAERAASDASHASSSAEFKKKLGLGIGLGIGLAILLVAAGVWLWFFLRRRNTEVEEREKHIQGLSHRTCNYYSPTGEMRQSNGRYGPNSPVYGPGDNTAFPTLANQIMRKPLHQSTTRGYYQSTPSSELTRSNTLGTAGPIHPIYEADEDDHASQISDIGIGAAFGEPAVQPKRFSDPFRDPPPNFSAPLPSSRNPSPDIESPQQGGNGQEVQQWFSDWAAADALLESQARSHSAMGRVSPSRKPRISTGQTVSSMAGEEEYDRAGSSLSDHSVSISSVSRSGSSSHRANSLRGFITNAVNPFNLLNTNPGPLQDPRQPPKSSGSGTSSFATAHTSFPTLQAEGETLLPRPGEEVYSYDRDAASSSPDSVPTSPSKTRRGSSVSKRSTWLGSLRRVLVGDSAFESSRDLSTRSPSPVHPEQAAEAAPRRTVSASATLLRRKQGRGDWEDSEDLESRSRATARSSTFAGDLASGAGSTAGTTVGDEDEWDVERAVQNRVVQVMFTVPKERLRVVNQDIADDGSDAGSLRSKKGSNRSLRDAGALGDAPPLRTRELTPLVEDSASGGSRDSSPRRARGRVMEIVDQIEKSDDGTS